MVNVITMSFATFSDIAGWEDKIALLDNAGVEIFASTANNDNTVPTYPSAYLDVIGVSGIFDDGNLVYGPQMNSQYIGDRVTSTKSDDYLQGKRGAWGATYGSQVKFTAPAFDFEVVAPGDRISGQTPHENQTIASG